MTAAAVPARLKREMSPLGAVVITFTNVSPTLSVLILGSVLIHQAGSFAVAGCLFAALFGVLIAGQTAELGSAFPNAGGNIVFAGATLGPAFRFMGAANAIYATPVGLALTSLGAAGYLRVVFPQVPVIPAAIVLIALATGLAALSVRVNAWVTGVFLAIELLAVAITAGLGFLHPHNELLPLLAHPMMAKPGGGLQGTSISAMALGTISALYVMNGYQDAVLFGEEIVAARRKLRRIILVTLLLAALTIIPPIAAVMVGAPDLARLAASPQSIQDFIREVGGARLANMVSIGIVLAVFNAMIAGVMMSSRVWYAIARDNIWHPLANRALNRVHGKFGSPWVATFGVGSMALICCFFPQSLLAVVTGSGIAISYGMNALCVMAGRVKGTTAHSLSRMPMHPLGPILVVGVAVTLLSVALMDPETGRPGVIFNLTAMAGSGLYYQLVVRRSRTWVHYEPEEEEEGGKALAAP